MVCGACAQGSADRPEQPPRSDKQRLRATREMPLGVPRTSVGEGPQRALEQEPGVWEEEERAASPGHP